jgi:NAD(P)-dependent dehydrogenase (short-subunit alcohol dehydrogenase family)
MTRLANKVVVVTGGASGIGKATVELCVSEGARVVFGDILDADGEALAKALGPNAVYIHADVRSEADIERLLGTAVSRFGQLDCLVNNAGISKALGAIATISIEDWDDHLNVNLRGVFLGMKHAAPIMMGQGRGSIINLGSVAGIQAGFGPYPYSAAKAAIAHLSCCAATELGAKGVRVNCVCPGAIATPIFGKSFGLTQAAAEQTVPKLEAAFAQMQPLQRSGMPHDIAQCIVWLASDESSFANGQQFVIDGGLTSGRLWSMSQAIRQQLMTVMGIE